MQMNWRAVFMLWFATEWEKKTIRFEKTDSILLDFRCARIEMGQQISSYRRKMLSVLGEDETPRGIRAANERRALHAFCRSICTIHFHWKRCQIHFWSPFIISFIRYFFFFFSFVHNIEFSCYGFWYECETWAWYSMYLSSFDLPHPSRSHSFFRTFSITLYTTLKSTIIRRQQQMNGHCANNVME